MAYINTKFLLLDKKLRIVPLNLLSVRFLFKIKNNLERGKKLKVSTVEVLQIPTKLTRTSNSAKIPEYLELVHISCYYANHCKS